MGSREEECRAGKISWLENQQETNRYQLLQLMFFCLLPTKDPKCVLVAVRKVAHLVQFNDINSKLRTVLAVGRMKEATGKHHLLICKGYFCPFVNEN